MPYKKPHPPCPRSQSHQKTKNMARNPNPTTACLLLLFIFPSLILAVYPTSQIDAANNASDFIRTSCSATLYPVRCCATLARYSNFIQQSPSQLAIVAVSVSLRRARRASAYLSSLCHGPISSSNPSAAAALRDCDSTFGDAVDQMKQSLAELHQLKTGEEFLWQMSNVETWMSAALTNEDTCTDGFEELPAGDVKEDVCGRVARVKELTSNALALVNSLASKQGSSPSQAVDPNGRGF